MSARFSAPQIEQGYAFTTSGANQKGVRAHNERLVLSQLRTSGALSKAEIARRTGLSAQAISVIMRNLEGEGLLTRGPTTKGKVGQPSVPMALNPDGVFSIGLRLGRRSSDLALMDFVGNLRKIIKVTYTYPTPERIMDFMKERLPEIRAMVDDTRILGIGIGAPFELYNWLDRLGAPQDQMSAWRNFDLAAAVEEQTGLPTSLVNDATGACVAEHGMGAGRAHDNFAYFFIGSFVGGGIVLNSFVQTGPTGNAGALGPLPSAKPDHPDAQLIDTASLYLLERKISAADMDAAKMWQVADNWQMFEPHVSNWIEETAPAMARAVLTVCAVIDFPVVVIDGAFPESVRADLVKAVKSAIRHCNTDGIVVPEIIAGDVGADARVQGAALLQINSRYFVDPAHALAN